MTTENTLTENKTASHNNDTRTMQQLEESYHSLTNYEKEIFQIAALISEPLTSTQLFTSLKECDVRGAENKTFNVTHYNLIIKKLQALKLLQPGAVIRCNELWLEEAIKRALKNKRFDHHLATIRKQFPFQIKSSFYFNYYPPQRIDREIRMAVYTQDFDQINNLLKFGLQQYPDHFNRHNLLVKIFINDFDSKLWNNIPPSLRLSLTINIADFICIRLLDPRPFLDYLESLAVNQTNQFISDTAIHIRGFFLLLQGEFNAFRSLLTPLSQPPTKSGNRLLGIWHFLHGDFKQAIASFESVIEISNSNQTTLPNQMNFIALGFHILALIGDHQPGYQNKISSLIQLSEKRHLEREPNIRIFSPFISAQDSPDRDLEYCLELLTIAEYTSDFFSQLLISVISYWLVPEKAQSTLNTLYGLRSQAGTVGYQWIERETNRIIAKLLTGIHASVPALSPANTAKDETISIIDIYKPQLEWEQVLANLVDLKNKSGPVTGITNSSSRLIWLVDFKAKPVALIPCEQRLTKKGDWSKGRLIKLQRLIDQQHDFLTPQDQKILAAAQKINSRYYYQSWEYHLDPNLALPAMVGHPLLFIRSRPEIQVELIKKEPEFLIERHADHLLVKLTITAHKAELLVIEETPTRYHLIEIKEDHVKIAKILRQKAIAVPVEAEALLSAAIESVSSVVTVHSDVSGNLSQIPRQEANSLPTIEMIPLGMGLKATIVVKPIADGALRFPPGIGGMVLFTEVEGKRIQIHRDFKQEIENAERIYTQCPTLMETDRPTNWQWIFPEPENALKVLSELYHCRDLAPLVWPEGGKMEIKQGGSYSQMKVKIEKDNEWFLISGKMTVDEKLTLEMDQLIELTENCKGRFIPLGEGDYLELSDELRHYMGELRTLTEKSKKGLRLHPLASYATADFFNLLPGLNDQADWRDHYARFTHMQETEINLPSTFRAELRDYQLAGFHWLARLAHLGIGACLADDMGLGKTIQGLALILYRAASGPTLVIAPASVCMNWIQEAKRFTPTLNPRIYSGPNRDQIVRDAQAFDLVICSYGLLYQDSEILADIQWTTVVLDEAQAIKNFTSKRARAAMNLQADFRMLTTGTPIENHLGELWSLFNFINPGLLGSRERFKVRYANPIAKRQDPTIKKQLKKLILPFILRRTKFQVLTELPEKTEVILNVELTPAERAFYEALRRRAVDKLSGLKAPPGAKHLTILAEIMKLRRACCDPRLLVPDSQIISSKLRLFGEVVEELLENKHKALVFSQFVDYLQIIKRWVERKKISYQYLDGSTPVGDRHHRVNAFQAGESDLFLISLKAGGLGLNLTAADYVIIMDPWWNPAVEDQAADRAHRIGQQYPVTIYRLVTQETIEEKIVNLHQMKRDLADSLLEGSDVSGKVSFDQLLQLIREQ